MDEKPKVEIDLLHDYVFRVSFPDADGTTLVMDEPEPLGRLVGPNASRVLAAAIGNCLSASLAFCLRKSRIDVKGIHTEVTPTLERNKEGYWRVTKMDVKVRPALDPEAEETRVKRCMEIFENYCVVAGAVRSGIEVAVDVSMPQK
ncbi:MAG: OsmC family protein [Thermoplasmata archaeon]|nr:OsmC family protein [Candidatus Sysuiplasma jiujiangense]